MAATRKSITLRVLLCARVFFLMCVACSYVFAQKGLPGNLVKITTDQYGFVVGTNKKDTLYFVAVTNARVTREDAEVSVIFIDGKANNKARLVNQFDVSGKNVALYRYVGSTAKKIEPKYFADFIVADHLEYSLLADGAGGREADFKINPYVHKIHKAKFQEMAPGKGEIYYFNKSGGVVQQGMPLLHESGKAVVGIVADNDGAKGDRFSVIKIERIAEQLAREDRNTCRYFNLLRVGESYTPCEKEAIRREEERKRHVKEDIERRNRTREQRREVRRTSDYWFSAGLTASYNWSSMSAQTTKGTESGKGNGYSVGMSILFNPNPTAFGGSIRPQYTSVSFNIPEENPLSLSSVKVKKLYMESYEMPLLFENGSAPFYFAVGYVPVWLKQTQLSYTVDGEAAERKEKIFGGPKYLHKAHAEIGFQINATRLGLIYQQQFGSFVNKQYEMIIDGEVIRPFQGFYDNYYTLSLVLTYRLWSKWRFKPEKV